MKANVTNLKKVLRMCAKAHNAKFCDWSGEGQVAIESEDIPVVSDVRTILAAFYGPSTRYADTTGWGFVVVYFDYFMYRNSSEVDMDLLRMALPYGSI